MTGTNNDNIELKSDAAYIVTGGLGSIGKSLVNWMIEKGARDIILIGRSDIPDAHQEIILGWEKQNIKVQFIQEDISNLENLKEKLRGAAASNIRGIFHTAALLNDKLLLSHDKESFEAVFPAKVQGAWNLHQLSLQWPLDHFVLFSSTVSLIGNTGQTNYAAANYFLNSLAAYRQNQNLPALSVCWGPWKRSKMIAGLADNFESLGIFSFSPETAFPVLEKAMQQRNKSGTFAAIQVQPGIFMNSCPVWLQDILPVEWQSTLQPELETPTPITTTFHTEEQVLSMLEALAREVLKLQPDAPLDINRPYYEMGFDSMMLSMLQRKVRQNSGITIPISQFFQYPTLNTLGKYLKESASPKVSAAHQSSTLSSDISISDIVRDEVSQLSDDEITRLLNQY